MDQVWNLLPVTEASMPQLSDAQKVAASMDTDTFIHSLEGVVARHPPLAARATDALATFQEQLEHRIAALTEDIARSIRRIQEEACKRQIELEVQKDKEKVVTEIRMNLMAAVKDGLLKPNTP